MLEAAMAARPPKLSEDDLAWNIATAAARGGVYASKALADEFRRRDLDSGRKKRVAEITYGLLRHGRTLEFAADRAGDPNRRRIMLAMRARLDDPKAADAAWAELRPALDALTPAARVGMYGSFPDWLGARLVEDFGEVDAIKLARALADGAPTDLRANRSRDELLTTLGDEGIRATALPRTTYGVRLADEPRDLYTTRAFQEGMFEQQDEGSQLVAELVAPNPGGLIIDACAGEGGKTLAIATMLEGKGRIVACDVSDKKLETLRRRAKRAGVTNVQTVLLPREGVLPKPLSTLKADRVLIDAPCSGIGTLRRNPEARQRLDRNGPTRLAGEQRAIAERFLPLVAPGGRLIYATCTVLREEDEQTVEAIRAMDPTLEPMRVVEIWGAARAKGLTDASGTNLRLFPNVHGTDGFFAAVLRRPA